jgi:phenylpropionate dioxygenase-like ring-hydroxylating dioxygenase large terminal subunit
MLGSPARLVFEIAEAAEPDRYVVLCGWTRMRASGLRLVENFLDMAHFPFVRTDILGAEPNITVPHYSARIDRDADEVWASGCQSFQPRITAAASAGSFAQLSYRVPTPFTVMLYRVCPTAPARLDVVAMFIQPIGEDVCRAQSVLYLVDQGLPLTEMLRFQQVISLQDRIVVENQRPVLLPLDPRAELPTRADSSSIAYRRLGQRRVLGRLQPKAARWISVTAWNSSRLTITSTASAAKARGARKFDVANAIM